MRKSWNKNMLFITDRLFLYESLYLSKTKLQARNTNGDW